MKKLGAIKLRNQLHEIKAFVLLLPMILSFVQEQPCSLLTLVTLARGLKLETLVFESSCRSQLNLMTWWLIIYFSISLSHQQSTVSFETKSPSYL